MTESKEPKDVLITDSQHCKEVVSTLNGESVLAVHCVILDKGFIGKLTLVLVGTCSGDVYLFDTQENVALFTDGGLQSLLESENILKVMKGCRTDSYTLYKQFKVKLHNVFDVKIADDVIEEHNGRLLHQRLNIQELCKKHSTYSQVLYSRENIEDFKEQSADQTEFWGTRPLTADMMSSAANLVRALIPHLYEKLKCCIENNQLGKILTERIQEEVTCCQDYDRNEQQKQRRKAIVMQVINWINDQLRTNTKYSDLTVDSDEKLAVDRVNYWEAKDVSPFIARLKLQSILSYLYQLDGKVRSEEEYPVAKFICQFLSTNESHPNRLVSGPVRKLQERIREITLKRIEQKYSMDTNLEDMATTELWVLESLFLKPTNDCQYPDVISRLYWHVFEAELDKNIELFQQWGKRRKECEPFYKKILFYADITKASLIASMPKSVQEKSQKLKRTYEN